MNDRFQKFDTKQLKATVERVVEINQILNGAEGPELKSFGFYLQDIRKTIVEDMKQENEDDDAMLRELDEYIDTHYANLPKQSNTKGKYDDQSSHWGSNKNDSHKMQKKHVMMQQFLHSNRPGEILETSESKKDFRDLKRMLGLSNVNPSHH